MLMDELEKQAGAEPQQSVQEGGGQEPQGAQEKDVPESRGTGQITLSEDGTLNIPDGFWDVADRPKQEGGEEQSPAAKDEGAEAKPGASPSAPGAKDAEPGPECYTPEELAEAFVNGEVDPRRLTGELVEAYNAIDAAVRRRAEAQRIEATMRPQSQPQQPLAQQQPATWAQLAEVAKVLAAQHYLGIKPEEFDEFNPQHVAARYTAMQDIRDRANAMAAQQQRAMQVQSQVAALWAEYRQKVPDIDEIGEKFFPVWRQKLTVLEDQRVNEILGSGDMGKLRGLIDRVVADYRGKAAPKPAQSAQTRETPPPVMGTAGGSPEGDRGIVDASTLGDMTIEEQAKWLVEHKFAV